MTSTICRPSRRSRWPLLALLVIATWAPSTALAQQEQPQPQIEILATAYNPVEGTLAVELRVDGSRDRELAQLTVLVESVPRTVDALPDARQSSLAVQLAIDTSGSMAGAPLAAAQTAARSLVEKLAVGDLVGVLDFADQPRLRLNPNSDHEQALRVIDALAAAGDTALHDAVIQGTQALVRSGAERKALVLLSDGEETGVSSASAGDVLAAIDAAEIEVYTFAFGAGADADFLSEVAERSGGAAWAVASDASLDELFASLGGRLGAAQTVVVRAPALTEGLHDLEVRARVDGQLVSAVTEFNVRAADLLIAAPGAVAPGEPIRVDVSGIPDGARIQASLSDSPAALTVVAGGVLIDPWLANAGDQTLRVQAISGRGPVAAGSVEITIPTLEPELQVQPGASEGVYVGTLRAQGLSDALLVAEVDGVEAGRSDEGSLTVTVPEDASTLTFLAFTRDLEPLARVDRQLEPGGSETGAGQYLVLALGLVLVGALAFWGWSRRRGRPSTQPGFRQPLSPLRAPLASAPPRAAAPDKPLGVLLVTEPDGTTRTISLGRRPITIGSDARCEVVITGANVRPQHARVLFGADGRASVHGLGDRGARPYDGAISDEWLTLDPGEEIAIGDWAFRIGTAAVEQEEAS